MIQFQEIIADAYVSPSRNIALPSMPGRQVKFLQGHAAIRDGRDLAAMLRRADVKIVLTDYSSSWIEEIEKAAGEVRADVRRPDAKAPSTGGTASDTSAAPAEEAYPESTPPEPEPLVRKGSRWDSNWPRDPKTGRLMKRNAVAADRAEPGP